jgi:hypothetical protein
MGRKRRKRAKQQDSTQLETASTEAPVNAWIEKDLRGRGYRLWGLSHIPTKVRIGLWLAVILLAPLYSVFQGIDLTDVGMALVDSDDFVNNGGYKTASSWTYLTNAICGLWMVVFGGLGFVAIKLGGAAVSWATAGFAYYGLRRSFGREPTLAALAVTTCFINTRSLVQWINYDTCSGLFYAAGVAFLVRGLQRRNSKLIAVAGFTFLLLRYVRFSSLLGLGFVLAIPLYYWLRNKDWVSMKKDLLAYGIGVLAGVVFLAGIGLATGAPLVLPGRTVAAAEASVEEDGERAKAERERQGYGVKSMATRMMKQYWAGTPHAAVFVLGLGVLAFLICKIPKTGPFVLLGSALVAYQWLLPKYTYSHCMNSLLVGGLCLILLGLRKRAPSQSVLAFLGLAMMVCGPAGSNTGLAKAAHTMWFAIPLLLLCPFRWRFVPLLGKRIPARPFAAGSLLLAAILVGGSVFLGWRNSYRDHPNRSLMNTAVDHPRLRLLRTFPERARVLQELLDNYEPHIAPDEYVLTYGSAPGLHYLMDRRSFFPSAWTELMHDRQTGKPMLVLEKAWAKAKKEERGAPILVIARGSCRNAIWPIQRAPLQEAGKATRLPGNNAIYKLAWAGEFFLIYRPDGTKIATVGP